ncbi:MAG TPA: right-handed parallel beta-helix repeat-containing protein, partial [Verrucomicrobiae bacterium]|nr:right-handed parallel beta-helix repeat-containing protein [Verrucomicrobiae bacterium]
GLASADKLDVSGTGMRNVNGSPTLINCVISGAGNFYYPSGGIYSTGGDLTAIDCVFNGNRSSRGGGLHHEGNGTVEGGVFSGNIGQFGGGMGVYNGTVTDCDFIGNSGYFGGGMYVHGSPTVTRCLFSGNAGFTDYGGGMHVYFTGSPTVTDCVFSGNTSASNTGGMLVEGNATVSNCTFVGNAGPAAGGLRGTGSATVTNCVFRANGGSGEIVGSASVTYSNVQGGYAGAGNIDADPLFRNPGGGDFRLNPGSPCIDAGNNLAVGVTTDFNGGSRFVDDPATPNTGVPGNGHPTDVVDMGAIEYGGLIRVPSDQPTIQAAINAALPGSLVLVAPGTYYQAINFNGKAITVRSSSGNPADTIINGNGATHVVQCVSGEGPDSVLSGFTITGGNAPGGYGAGMLNIGSSPTVTGCVFSGSTAQ